jgi:hypothetical protein
MSGFLNGLGNFAQFAKQSSSAVDIDGAHELPPLLTQSIRDLEQSIDRGIACTLADLVGIVQSDQLPELIFGNHSAFIC